ncbi:DUF6397 family protein [Streptomyces sp. NPDC056721]|uniref:DUF6397 family protein n=1 Tax=Streptomyces sp. NPDC056721 TaxID=3345923 RepID=UPI0036B59FB8
MLRIAITGCDSSRGSPGVPRKSTLNNLRPESTGHGAPDSPSARIAERIMTADDPHEIS